jgi:hypothetical protein
MSHLAGLAGRIDDVRDEYLEKQRIPAGVFDFFVDTTKVSKHKHLRWLAREFEKNLLEGTAPDGWTWRPYELAAELLKVSSVWHHNAVPRDLYRFNFIEAVELLKHRQRLRKLRLAPGTQVLIDAPEYVLLYSPNRGGACYYGRGTRWCIASISTLSHWLTYRKQGAHPYYLLSKVLPSSDARYKLAAMVAPGGGVFWHDARDRAHSRNEVVGQYGKETTQHIESAVQKHVKTLPTPREVVFAKLHGEVRDDRVSEDTLFTAVVVTQELRQQHGIEAVEAFYDIGFVALMEAARQYRLTKEFFSLLPPELPNWQRQRFSWAPFSYAVDMILSRRYGGNKQDVAWVFLGELHRETERAPWATHRLALMLMARLRQGKLFITSQADIRDFDWSTLDWTSLLAEFYRDIDNASRLVPDETGQRRLSVEQLQKVAREVFQPFLDFFVKYPQHIQTDAPGPDEFPGLSTITLAAFGHLAAIFHGTVDFDRLWSVAGGLKAEQRVLDEISSAYQHGLRTVLRFEGVNKVVLG